MTYNKYKLIHSTKYNFISNKKNCFEKILILIVSMISYNLNLQKFKINVGNNNKDILLRFMENMYVVVVQ